MRQLTIYDSIVEPPSYHDTVKVEPKERVQYEDTAKLQDERILNIFKEKKMLPPSRVWAEYNKKYGSILLTSTRRSITNLTTKGLLIKSGAKAEGLYGRKELVWKLAPVSQQSHTNQSTK